MTPPLSREGASPQSSAAPGWVINAEVKGQGFVYGPYESRAAADRALIDAGWMSSPDPGEWYLSEQPDDGLAVVQRIIPDLRLAP